MVVSVRGARPFEPDLWNGRPAVVGRKFNGDGTVRRFRGNTVISFVTPESPLGRCAGWARGVIEASAAAPGLTLLPPSSYHVTVIRLICDEDREPTKWSSHLDLHCPLQDVDAFMTSAMASVDPPEPIEIQYHAMSALDVVAIELEPASPAAAASLNSYRDVVAEATGSGTTITTTTCSTSRWRTESARSAQPRALSWQRRSQPPIASWSGRGRSSCPRPS